MQDHQKSEQQKFNDWVRQQLAETQGVVKALAIEFDNQIRELKQPNVGNTAEIRKLGIKPRKPKV